MKKLKEFCCWMKWHSFGGYHILGHDSGYHILGHDGRSYIAKCRWCGFEGMVDSQGNFF